MKNFHLTFALLFALLVSFQSKAKDGDSNAPKAEPGFTYSVRPVKDEVKVMVAFNNKAHEKVSIRIYNEQHQLVLSEVEGKEEVAKVYDLTALGKGHYMVELKTADLNVSKEFDLGMAHEDVLFSFEAGVYADKDAANKMILAYANAVTGNVALSIENNHREEVYSEQITNAHNYTQRFNMQDMEPGMYTVTLTYNNEAHSYSYAVIK